MTKIEEINRLHAEAVKHLQNYYDVAVQIGELLVEQKAKLGHGEWIPWIAANLTFGLSTTKNYMQIYRNSQRAGDLNETEKPKSQREALGQSAKQRKERKSQEEQEQLTNQDIKWEETKGKRILIWEKVKYKLEPILDEIIQTLDDDELTDFSFAIQDYIYEIQKKKWDL